MKSVRVRKDEMNGIRQASRLPGVSNTRFPVSVQDISFQLQRFVTVMARYHADSKQTIEPTKGLFPIEVDLSQVNRLLAERSLFGAFSVQRRVYEMTFA